MTDVILVGIGGFLGSTMRYLLGKVPIQGLTTFPLITLLINVIGSFLIGVVSAAAIKHQADAAKMGLFLQVGFCGGFTTFSAFSLETVNLVKDGNLIHASLYVILSVMLCFFGVLAGQTVAINAMR